MVDLFEFSNQVPVHTHRTADLDLGEIALDTQTELLRAPVDPGTSRHPATRPAGILVAANVVVAENLVDSQLTEGLEEIGVFE